MWVATKRTVRERTVTIRFHKQTIFSLSHLEGITQGAGEEVDGIAGEASGMGMNRIGEVGSWASKGHTAGTCGSDFIQY